jgi:hypothetical protein
MKTVGAFPFEENQSGIFHFGKPEVCFLYENQWSVSAGGIVIALCWQWSVVFPVHPLVSSQHPLGDCPWDCSCDCHADVSAAAIA